MNRREVKKLSVGDNICLKIYYSHKPLINDTRFLPPTHSVKMIEGKVVQTFKKYVVVRFNNGKGFHTMYIYFFYEDLLSRLSLIREDKEMKKAKKLNKKQLTRKIKEKQEEIKTLKKIITKKNAKRLKRKEKKSKKIEKLNKKINKRINKKNKKVRKAKK